MENSIHAVVTTEPINVQDGYDFVKSPSFGAFNSFIGTVRNNHEDNDVVAIDYDAHEELAKSVLLQICQEAKQQWQDIRVYATHFKGKLEVGGISILIIVGSTHRDESFKACRYIIEEIKKRLPVWKQEYYKNGKSSWLPGHSLKQN